MRPLLQIANHQQINSFNLGRWQFIFNDVARLHPETSRILIPIYSFTG